MDLDVLFDDAKGSFAGLARLFHAAETAKRVFQLHDGLIVGGIEFAGLAEELGRLFHVVLRETGAAVEVEDFIEPWI